MNADDEDLEANDWYEPLLIEDILKESSSLKRFKKCRLLGYLQLCDGSLFLQNVTSALGENKVKIRVEFEKSLNIPLAIMPQGAQIFGHINYKDNIRYLNQSYDEFQREESFSTNNNANPKDDIYIKVEIFHFLSPSIILKLHETLQEISNDCKISKTLK